MAYFDRSRTRLVSESVDQRWLSLYDFTNQAMLRRNGIPLEKILWTLEFISKKRTLTIRACSHTGTTDFANRSDALLTAAKLILHSHNLATEYSCLASTGILNLEPGSVNTVPGTVQFSLDIRAGEDDRLMRLEESLKSDFEKIANGEAVAHLNKGGTRGRGCSVEWRLDAPSRAVHFDKDCIRCVEDSAAELFGDRAQDLTQSMISGAGT